MVKSRVLLVSLLGAAAVAVVPLVTAIGMQRSEPSASDIGLLAGVIQLVNRAYVHPISSDELTKDALKGMLTRLDPHSDYMDEQEFKQSQSDMAGAFGGLGMQISEQNEIPKVISPIDGTPAAHAGLEPGDQIILINHASTQGVEPVQGGEPVARRPRHQRDHHHPARQAGAVRRHAHAGDHPGRIGEIEARA